MPVAVAGVLLGIAFLPGPFGFLAWFALIPLFDALQSRLDAGASGWRLFRLGYLFGFVFFLITGFFTGMGLQPCVVTSPRKASVSGRPLRIRKSPRGSTWSYQTTPFSCGIAVPSRAPSAVIQAPLSPPCPVDPVSEIQNGFAPSV